MRSTEAGRDRSHRGYFRVNISTVVFKTLTFLLSCLFFFLALEDACLLGRAVIGRMCRPVLVERPDPTVQRRAADVVVRLDVRRALTVVVELHDLAFELFAKLPRVPGICYGGSFLSVHIPHKTVL